MIKKIIWTLVIILALILGYWLISPFWRTEIVSESLPLATGPESEANLPNIVKQGSFTGFDKVHNGSGTATILSIEGKNYVRFEDDFMVNNGPDLYVGMGANGKYIKGSELALLKGNVGSQNYEIPETIDLASIDEIWIWCKAFSVPFARAVLQ